MTEHWFFWLFATVYFIHLFVEFGLDWLNIKEVEKNRDRIPALYQDVFSIEEYQKSIAYTRAKTQFGWIKNAFDVVVLWTLIFTGGFQYFYDLLDHTFLADSFWRQVAYPFVIGGIFYVLHLPFGIYYQFVLEEKFGFNKTKAPTFIGDQIKTMVLSIVIGAPILALLFKTVGWMGSWWWLGGWGVMMGFQFISAALFPILLMPLFYKFTPLPEGDLKEKIHALAKKIKFDMSGVFTIDGSKRSAHSNAFFAGMGKTRRIVLFDTLEKNLSQAEIISVLAHEMGHNKKKHIIKSLILSSIGTLVAFYVLSLLLGWQPFYQAFGVTQPALSIGFLLFGLLSGVFTFPLTPIFNWISRKNEYEADEFSVHTTGDKEHMTSSLVKLSKDNLSNLTPHPLYSFFHYSHPTTVERAKAIEAIPA